MSRYLGLFVLAISTAAQTLTPAQRQLNIDSFEQVWKTVLEKHWDPKLNGVDWQAAHDELRPKLDAAKTMDEARDVMSALLERLGQTHFGIIPVDVYGDVDAPESGEATPGLDVRVIGGQVLITSVDPGSPAESHGIKSGWELRKIDGAELAPIIKRIQTRFANSTLLDLRQARSILGRLEGPENKTVHLDLVDGAGMTIAMEVERAAPRGKVIRMGSMPPQHVWSEWRKARPD